MSTHLRTRRFSKTKVPKLKGAVQNLIRRKRVSFSLMAGRGKAAAGGDGGGGGGATDQAPLQHWNMVKRSITEVDDVFNKLDADQSGSVDAHELKQFFKAANSVRSLFFLSLSVRVCARAYVRACVVV